MMKPDSGLSESAAGVSQGACDFEQLTALSPDIIFIYHYPEDRLIYCNQRVSEVLGWTVDEFMTRHIRAEPDGIHPDDQRDFIRWLDQAQSAHSEAVHQTEQRIRHADGRWICLRLRVSAFRFDSGGAIVELLGTASDITQEVAARAALQHQSGILDLILNSMQEGVIVCDQRGDLLLVNQSAERVLKLDRPLTNVAQIRAAHSQESDAPSESRMWHQHPLSRALKGETVNGCELSLYDKRRNLALTLSHASAPLRDKSGQVIGAVDVFRDVTENHKAHQELQRAEEHFRLLVEGTTDYAIFMLDTEGQVLSWNPGAERILGYRKSEILGKSFATFFTAEDQLRGEPERKLQQAMADGRSEEDSWRVRKDGQRFWCSGVMGALHDALGKLTAYVEIMRDNTERRIAEQNVYYLANHDPLTALPNRSRFLEKLHEALLNTDRDNTQCALLLLDLDRFKVVNDSLGHHTGDQLLKLVAARLLECVRETDTVARLGGDEFVVILTRLKSLTTAEILAESLIVALSKPFEINGHQIQSGSSVGVAMYPQDGSDAGELLQRADLAMYRAKSNGRNRYRVFSPGMLNDVHLKQQQEEQLRSAITQGSFELAFQPQLDLNTLEVVGVEALLRCHNPLLMTLPTLNVIALAKEIGMTAELGEWVLNASFQQALRWRNSGYAALKMCINISPEHLMLPSFVETVGGLLNQYQIPPHLIEIEITEAALVEISAREIDVMDRLKQLGVNISIDDFGKGVSTLSYLKDFPVDVLKIDPSLIRNLPRDQDDGAIVSAIIKLAKDLQIKVLAEGVESFDQLNFLRTTPCHYVQGFLFSEPLRAEKFEEVLQHRIHHNRPFH